MLRTRYAGGVPIEAKQLCRISTGSYTGDGTLSNPITGVGFTPRYLRIVAHVTGARNVFESFDVITAGQAMVHISGGGHQILGIRIVSLDADGFTVDDQGTNGDPNGLGVVYDYVAFG